MSDRTPRDHATVADGLDRRSYEPIFNYQINHSRQHQRNKVLILPKISYQPSPLIIRLFTLKKSAGSAINKFLKTDD